MENGQPIDLAPYFHAYILDKEIEGITFRMTYYADNHGQPGEELEGAPSKAGTYYAKAEFVPEGDNWTQEVEVDGTVYHIPLSRGWTSYTIQPASSGKTRRIRMEKIRIRRNREDQMILVKQIRQKQQTRRRKR